MISLYDYIDSFSKEAGPAEDKELEKGLSSLFRDLQIERDILVDSATRRQKHLASRYPGVALPTHLSPSQIARLNTFVHPASKTPYHPQECAKTEGGV